MGSMVGARGETVRTMAERVDAQAVPGGRVTSPAPRDAWQEAYRSDPFALETQAPEWADAMCEGGHYTDVSRLYDVGGRVLVLPMLRRRAGGIVPMDAANPLHCGAGGLLAPGGATADDTAVVFADLASRRVVSQVVWPNPLLAPAYAASVPVGATVVPRRGNMLDLRAGFDHVWNKQFKGSARTGVRKAEKEGVELEVDATGRLIPELYEMLESAVSRWARIQNEPLWLATRRQRARDPLERFEAIARHLGDRCRVYIARIDGKTAAAQMMLQGTNAYDFRAAMDEEMKRSRAQDLIERATIQDACEAGCHYYYMGDSGASEALSRYKEQFGAETYAYAEFRLERLPISRTEQAVKGVIKRAIGFKD